MQEFADVTDMKLTWRKGKSAPRSMFRFCNAVVDKTIVYFNANGDNEIYSYNTSRDLWTPLPNCPNRYSSFVIIDKMLTTVGGKKDGHYSSELYSLKEGGVWVEEFPPMPTKHSSATVICTGLSLIVVGGVSHGLS